MTLTRAVGIASAPMPRSPASHPAKRPIAIWLVVVYLMIFAIVVIGGVTRLTGSGLSMVEWRPLMGTLPPLSQSDWLAVFERYQESPQYAQVNHWMTLSDFKRIFFWEYLHRLFGRLIGLVFFIPFAWFIIRRRLRGSLALKTFVAFLGGGLQGLLGWYMVRSGLVDRPAVSHLRLAAHLMLALALAQWLLWIVLDFRPPAKQAAPRRFRVGVWAVLALLSVQIAWGAFMAGTRAGHMYSTFPDMHGEMVPSALFQLQAPLSGLVNDPMAIHFVHRSLAWLLAVAVLLLAWRAGTQLEDVGQRRAVRWMLAAVVVQFLLGVLTVVYHVPIVAAVAHQAGAFVLLSTTVWAAHRLRGRSSATT